jgi:hypothetical protein
MSELVSDLTPQDFRVPVLIEESAGLARHRDAVRLGVPMPRGLLRAASDAIVLDATGRILEHQTRALAVWPDGSVKWLLVDLLTSLGAHQSETVFVCPAGSATQADSPSTALLAIVARDGLLVVDTGRAIFEVGSNALLPKVRVGGVDCLAAAGARVRLSDGQGRNYEPVAGTAYIEEAGPIRASIVVEGGFGCGADVSPLLFKARFTFIRGEASLRLDFRVHNPQAAKHPGGLWDLADGGAVLFKDLSLELTPASAARELRWYSESSEQLVTLPVQAWSLYQDSSGGENWNSDNHLDAAGQLSVSFQGYRVKAGAGPDSIAVGKRATPCLHVIADMGQIAATALEFWQTFPKALRWDNDAIGVGLFPRESRGLFVLQGGERKAHTVVLDFPSAGQTTSIPRMQQPLRASVDPTWAQSSGVMGSFVAASLDRNTEYLQYVGSIIEGPNSFAAKRELIDEYGWRNFGELYADHEAVRHAGARPLVSHYNNQYDFIYGALIHFLRTGDSRWRQLGEESARHTMDIDIYHTDRDKAAFNHGLFWHTDHYQPAATCTHRTYSGRNGGGSSYGGGPSNEHNYTSGLLLYHYLSGDPEAAAAVQELAGWVIAMDDGANNVLGLIDSGPTGLASKTVDPAYHKAGRGAGNSINALLDAYRLSNERRYVDKAEELIRRCIHPDDDIAELQLTEPEFRWSYLVFLQVVGKYLDFKQEWGEADYAYHYACASLLHYARWMAEHEVPYKDVLNKVLLPTETWPAHDVRKSHVLHVAAGYMPAAERARVQQRADYFFARSVGDLLSFPTAFLTRPQVILCVYGHVQAYYQASPEGIVQGVHPAYSFGQPQSFTPQKQRLRASLRSKVRLLRGHIARAGLDKILALQRRFLPWRS